MKDSLWRSVICRKFGEVEGGQSTCDLRGGFGTGVWKEIGKEWNSFFQNAIFARGNGRRVSFWKDPWCGEEALSLSFPSLYSLVVRKDARVAKMWDSSRVKGSWLPTFLRALNDWEMEEVERFLLILFRRKICTFQEHKLLLKKAKANGFVVKVIYTVLHRSCKTRENLNLNLNFSEKKRGQNGNLPK